MPATINGIGTHYYGAGNRSARVDSCQFCKRSATLSSYDTREWFCILFIPIIPMRKFRILNDCSSCRRHQRISADEFKQKLAQATAPIRTKMRQTPSDPEPHIQLIRTLIAWEMRADAERELQSAVARFPQNIELILVSAQLAIGRSDLKNALPLFERAYGLEPQNTEATYGYGWTLHQLERHEQAIPILQKAAAQDGNKVGSLYLLGKSQMQLGRWNDALNAYQQILSLDAAYMQDKNLLRLIRDCKNRLGYQLSDAERRAGRRWWPFGGGTKKRPALQSQPTLVRPSLRYAGLAILAIAVVGLAFFGWDRWTNMVMYFDNGTDRAVKVELDGRHFDIARNTFHKEEEMKEGAHTVIVRGTDGKEIERMTFSLAKMSPIAAAMHDRFFVYNVAGQRVYRRAVHGYAKSREESSYSDELIAMQRFLEQRDVDYPFAQPPQTISVDSNRSSRVLKVSFNVADDVDLRKYALIRMQEGKTDEAKKAIARAVETAPCDTATRRAQIYLASVAGSPEIASETAHHWIADCAENDLEAHRAYQDVNTENGKQQAVREEYLKLLNSAPDSGKAHYLYGRVAGDPTIAIAQYEQAVRLDPKLVWPHVALGHAYQSMERYQDAMRELSTAVDMEGRDPSVVIYYATAAIASGSPGLAVPKVDEIRKTHGRDLTALHARWLLALASSDWEEAVKIQKMLSPLENSQTEWWRNAKLLRMKNDPSVDDKIKTAIQTRELRPIAVQMKIERLMDSGDFAQAVEVIGKSPKDLDPTSAAMMEAYAAGGLILQNNAAAATKLLAEAEKALEGEPRTSGQRVTSAVVHGLRGDLPVDAVMSVARESDATAHAWFVAAVRAAQTGDRRKASEGFQRCIRAASDLDFPYLEAKAMAAALR